MNTRTRRKTRNWAPGTTYSMRGAREALGISYRNLMSAIDAGDIKTFSFGGRLLIPASEIERLKPLLQGTDA